MNRADTVTEIRTAQPRYIGWRYWAAGKMDLDGEIRPVLLSPAIRNARWLDATTHTSTCTAPLWARHAAPVGPECGCGIRIVRRLPNLIHYMRKRHQQEPGVDPLLGPCVAIGRVEGWGHIEPGVPWRSKDIGDPSDTIRAESVRILGPLFFSPAIAVWQDDFHRYFPVQRRSSGLGTYQEWLTRISRLSDAKRKQPWPA